MALDLFAGIPPAFFPNDTEAVWELAEHRYLYIEHLPGRAGHALHTLFVEGWAAVPSEATWSRPSR
jgi:hypothetical protein